MFPTQSPPLRPAHAQMVDLFAGPGGLDVAAHWLGVATDGIEWDPNACDTRRKAGLSTFQGDVRAYGPDDFPDATILAGGPPCQTYTVAGGGAGRRALDVVLALVRRMEAREDIAAIVEKLDDERTGLVLEPLRWALEAHDKGRPYEAIVLEQVPAVLPVWQSVKHVLEGIGYQADCGVLRAEAFGVPQTRRRAILIARRWGPPRLPRPTHWRYRRGAPSPTADAKLRPWVGMGRALGRAEHFVVVSNYGTGGDPKARGRRSSFEPAATVTGKISRNRLMWSDDTRFDRFTVEEAGLLQTFPIDYPWSGRDIPQQIGNAIPPRLAVHVLAAALGQEVDSGSLDAAVAGSWSNSYRRVAMTAAAREPSTDLVLDSLFSIDADAAGATPRPHSGPDDGNPIDRRIGTVDALEASGDALRSSTL